MGANRFCSNAFGRYDENEEEDGEEYESLSGASPDAVVPGKDGELVKTSDKIPARSNVPGDEDAERQDREGVHESSAA